jgi:hypothetical protein
MKGFFPSTTASIQNISPVPISRIHAPTVEWALPTPIAIELKVIAVGENNLTADPTPAIARQVARMKQIHNGSRLRHEHEHEEMFRIIATDHTGITVSNLEQSLAFGAMSSASFRTGRIRQRAASEIASPALKFHSPFSKRPAATNRIAGYRATRPKQHVDSDHAT